MRAQVRELKKRQQKSMERERKLREKQIEKERAEREVRASMGGEGEGGMCMWDCGGRCMWPDDGFQPLNSPIAHRCRA